VTATPPVRLAPAISFMKPRPPTSCFQYVMSVPEVSTICSTPHDRIHGRLTLRLDLNQLHPRVLRATSVHTVSQVAEPGLGALAPDLLDARVGVVACDALAGDRHPVLIAGVEERDVDLWRAVLEVVELLAVGVGEEEEVGAGALGDGHGAADGLEGGVLVCWVVGGFGGCSRWSLDLRLRLDGRCPGYRS
jgi:hypothetical protein